MNSNVEKKQIFAQTQNKRFQTVFFCCWKQLLRLHDNISNHKTEYWAREESNISKISFIKEIINSQVMREHIISGDLKLNWNPE